jgi:hypothetical protein
MTLRETLINCLGGRIAALRGARNLDISLYMPRLLRSVRLVLHPAQTINQCFPRIKGPLRNKCRKIPQDFCRMARKRNRRVLSATQGDADAAIGQKDAEDAAVIS